MDELNFIVNNTQFSVNEASFATVGDYWKDMVTFYKHNRIYYITEGSAELYLKGKKLHLEEGNLYFIPSYSVINADCQVFLSHYYIHFQADKVLSNLFDSLNFSAIVKANKDDEVIFQKMIECINIQPPTLSSLLFLNGSLQILLSKFFSKAEFINYDILRFSEIISYIEKNITKHISIKELASIANLNETYFSNTFKKAIGIAPIQFVINKKINYSMTLLCNNTYRVKEVAYQLGFKDEYYFSRLFKQKTGISPSEFMSSYNK